jgi:hypothetical protein
MMALISIWQGDKGDEQTSNKLLVPGGSTSERQGGAARRTWPGAKNCWNELEMVGTTQVNVGRLAEMANCLGLVVKLAPSQDDGQDGE